MFAMSSPDEHFMRAALACAAAGRGAVEPNPMVGAVVVCDGREIACGWHRQFGGPHAEREALSAAADTGSDVGGTTMYVTLEPCCRHGKTPPCTDAIIQAGIARVVVAMVDPDERVSGEGIGRLEAAGVDVTVGVCGEEARRLLRPYIKLRTSGRPWVICKWAQTADGYLALPAGQDRWVSSQESRDDAHRLRGLCDGILVGVNTVLADDPLLTCRVDAAAGQTLRQPVRVVLDSRLRTPPESRLAQTADLSPVIVATTPGALDRATERATALAARSVVVLPIAEADGRVSIPALLDELGRRQWTHLLVEGGPTVLDAVVRAGLADEVMVYVSPRRVAASGWLASEDADDLPCYDIATVAQVARLAPAERQSFGPDTLLRYRITQ